MKKVTEKWLLDNLNGITVSRDLISEKGNTTCFWSYFAGCGYDSRQVSTREEADSIRVEHVEGEFGDRDIYTIRLKKYTRNKMKTLEAQKLIKDWEDKVAKY